MDDSHKHEPRDLSDHGASDEASRREIIERARRLIADPDHPDQATRERIAGLLADSIESVDPEFPSPPSL